MFKKLALITIGNMLIFSPAKPTQLDLGYNNQYLSEGRDLLNANGIYWISGAHSVNSHVNLLLIFGTTINSQINYNELNLGLEYTNSFSGIDYTFGLTHLAFFEDNAVDNELQIRFSYAPPTIFTPFTQVVYSLEENGFFVELGILKDIDINDNLTISPHLLFAYDFGYTGAINEGFNHTSIGLNLSYMLSERLTVNGIIEKTYGGSIIKREVADGEHNQLMAGLNVNYSW